MGFIDKAKKAAEKVSSSKHQAESEENRVTAAETKKIEDVLQVLQISPTFEIPNEVFMPEDLKDVRFDVQVPSGYDVGQVTKFVNQSRASIRFFVELLGKRNEDIAKLATTVDRLQVDTNNLRLDNEIANGISLMPTSDDPDAENQLMEAKLTIRRLEDRNRKLEKEAAATGPAPLSDGEREAYSNLMDELSVAQRRNASLEEDVFHLKNQVAQYEDLADDELDQDALPPTALSEEELSHLGLPAIEEDDSSLPVVTPRKPGIRLPPVAEVSHSEIIELDDDPEDVPLAVPSRFSDPTAVILEPEEELSLEELSSWRKDQL